MGYMHARLFVCASTVRTSACMRALCFGHPGPSHGPRAGPHPGPSHRPCAGPPPGPSHGPRSGPHLGPPQRQNIHIRKPCCERRPEPAA
eukprot:353069-Chlamydomonas_euryale.AAC.1